MIRSRAFTLIELLIVVVIIATLAGLSFVGLQLLNKSRRKTETLQLLSSLQIALTTYQDDHGKFGDGSMADFTAKPWLYLHRRQTTGGSERQPYLVLKERQLARAGQKGPCRADDAEVILDGWGNPLLWNQHLPSGRQAEISVAIGSGSKRTVSCLTVASSAGTPETTSDDLILRYDADTDARWEVIKGR